MHQKTLLKTALIVAFSGLIILFFLTPDISPQSIVIEGEIIEIQNEEKITFITFLPYDFTVISFQPVENITGRATLIGKLASYDGKVEFITEEIR
jgi:hypothetical protein